MPVNRVSKNSIYLHGLAIVETDPADRRLRRVNRTLSATSGNSKLHHIPIDEITLAVSEASWLALLTERHVSVFIDAPGRERDYHVRDVLRGLVSYHYDPESGQNSFVAAEAMLIDPSYINSRVQQALGLLASGSRMEIGGYYPPALAQLIELHQPS